MFYYANMASGHMREHTLFEDLSNVDKTIIPLALVGDEMIIANSALRASLAIYHLISNARSWNNC